jgi:hypothetical protein
VCDDTRTLLRAKRAAARRFVVGKMARARPPWMWRWWCCAAGMMLLLAAGMLLLAVGYMPDTAGGQSTTVHIQRRIASQSRDEGPAAVNSPISPPAPAAVLAVLTTFKRDIDIARASLLWRRDNVQALFLLPTAEPLTAAEERELLRENVTVG